MVQRWGGPTAPLNRSLHVYILGSFDPKSKKYSKKDMFLGIFGMMLYHNMTERNNVNGFMGFADLTDFQLKHQTWWNLDDMKRFSDIMNVCRTFWWFTELPYWFKGGFLFQILGTFFHPLCKRSLYARWYLTHASSVWISKNSLWAFQVFGCFYYIYFKQDEIQLEIDVSQI